MTAARAGSARVEGTGLPADSSPLTSVDVPSADDAWLFGWDPLPGIVSVWADRSGQARVWQRTADGVRCREDRFRPWVFAAGLDDVRHLGTGLVAVSAADAAQAPVSYRALDGPPGSLRYLLSACDGRALHRAILQGAGRRLGRVIVSLRELSSDYYSVGPVEQYLMASGRVYFRGLAVCRREAGSPTRL